MILPKVLNCSTDWRNFFLLGCTRRYWKIAPTVSNCQDIKGRVAKPEFWPVNPSLWRRFDGWLPVLWARITSTSKRIIPWICAMGWSWSNYPWHPPRNWHIWAGAHTFSATFSGTLLNLTWLCTKASKTFSGTFGTCSGTSLNLTRRLHQCTPELFWAEDPITLRGWRKTVMTSSPNSSQRLASTSGWPRNNPGPHRSATWCLPAHQRRGSGFPRCWGRPIILEKKDQIRWIT